MGSNNSVPLAKEQRRIFGLLIGWAEILGWVTRGVWSFNVLLLGKRRSFTWGCSGAETVYVGGVEDAIKHRSVYAASWSSDTLFISVGFGLG